MKTKYEEIVNTYELGKHVDINLNRFFINSDAEGIKPASEDKIKRLLLAIDNQFDFMEGGALGVKGSIGDIKRTTKFIYNNINGITEIMCSLDTHYPQQIFFPCWWVNKDGRHPNSFTVITLKDVIDKKWIPAIGNKEKSINYLKGLEEASNGKTNLVIWPYHTIMGTPGHGLEAQFARMVYFHALARKTVPTMIVKGTEPCSEMYGIIKPEFSQRYLVNTEVLKAIQLNDEIYIVGEAKNYCLGISVMQIVNQFIDTKPEVLKKITILEDCTSPIHNTKEDIQSTKDMFDYFRSVGIRIAKSTDIKF